MEAVRMVLVTLTLVLTAVLVLALVAHAGAWIRRHRVGQADVAAAPVGGRAVRGQRG
jgi:hypothetical protein